MSTTPDVETSITRASTYRDQGQLRDAEAAIREAWTALGVDRRALHTKGPRSLGDVIDVQKLHGCVRLIALEADVLRLEGDRDSARTVARWALSALLHAAPPGDYADLTRELVTLADTR